VNTSNPPIPRIESPGRMTGVVISTGEVNHYTDNTMKLASYATLLA